MAPPGYGDLGKSARDVFGKGYHFSVMKLEVKTKTATGVEFSTEGSSNTDSGKVAGSLETKYKCKDYGLTFTEKWSTDNQLATKVELADKPIKGAKLVFDSTFSPQSGAKNGKIKADYKHDMVTVAADMDLNLGGPVVNASAVVGHQGWLAGYQMAFDTSKSQLTKNNFAIGFSNGDFTLHTNVNDGQVFGGSVHQKVNKDLETAVNLGWTASKNETNFGIGCKYALDKEASVRAKINNSSQVGLGYQQKLRDGVTITLSTLIDGKNFNQGGHKVGMALELEA
jgi:voltage-dependent anion channel protein 2